MERQVRGVMREKVTGKGETSKEGASEQEEVETFTLWLYP